MFREKSPLKAAGALLALNDVVCILGMSVSWRAARL
jgi:hypothetical protein